MVTQKFCVKNRNIILGCNISSNPGPTYVSSIFIKSTNNKSKSRIQQAHFAFLSTQIRRG